MKYSTSYRTLLTNPRAKTSHKCRALMKRRERIEATKRTAAMMGGAK